IRSRPGRLRNRSVADGNRSSILTGSCTTSCHPHACMEQHSCRNLGASRDFPRGKQPETGAEWRFYLMLLLHLIEQQAFLSAYGLWFFLCQMVMMNDMR